MLRFCNFFPSLSHRVQSISIISPSNQIATVHSRTPPKNRNLLPLPKLVESELEEIFQRGSGPGGQVINKSSIAVSLIHHASGLRVVCQESRSRETNRVLARRLMQLKLDNYLHQQLEGGTEVGKSRMEMVFDRIRAKKASAKRKGRRKRESEEI